MTDNKPTLRQIYDEALIARSRVGDNCMISDCQDAGLEAVARAARGELAAGMSAQGLHVYKYPRPALTVDLVIATRIESELHVLTIIRGKEPFQGKLALPGGFVEPLEQLVDAAARELLEETGVRVSPGTLKLFGVFDKPERDPRERVIAHAFHALIPFQDPTAGDDAAEAHWVRVQDIGDSSEFAFDHYGIMAEGLHGLR